jgi:hypothetical protein
VNVDPRTLADRLRSMVRDPDAVGTHYDECWQWHDDCALLLAADRLALWQSNTEDAIADAGDLPGDLTAWSAISRLTAQRDDLAARLNTARFVADNWRAHMVAADQPVAIAAHPLCMVLAALDGETDPEQLGLDPEDAPALTAAVQPPDPEGTK